MKTLIAALALASIVSTSAVAKTERSRAVHVDPNNSVICGHVLADPDPGIRAETLCNFAHYERGN
jgi:hypothetical protein